MVSVISNNSCRKACLFQELGSILVTDGDRHHVGGLPGGRVHGVQCMRFVGDGDSSVHATLVQSVPVWGHAIKKQECANHACECYYSALEKLVQEKPAYKGKGGLTERMCKRLTSAARCAI